MALRIRRCSGKMVIIIVIAVTFVWHFSKSEEKKANAAKEDVIFQHRNRGDNDPVENIATYTDNNCPKHDLAGSDWKVQNANGSISCQASVPGGIYSDLERAGILNESVYFRFNDVNYAWIGRENWTYSKVFAIPKSIKKFSNIMLNLDGIDTVAEITFNDHQVGKTENMFVRYSFDILEHIQWVKKNTLVVKFQSPVLYARSKFEEHSKNHYIVPPESVPMDYNGENHANFIRKTQSSFGWDIGPSFPSSGIYRPIWIQAFQSAKIEYLTFETDLVEDEGQRQWKSKIKIIIQSEEGIEGDLGVEIHDIESGEPLFGTTASVVSELFPEKGALNEFVVEASIFEDKVKKWWPNGMGEQNLYQLRVFLVSDGRILSTKVISIGFRIVQLIQQPLKELYPSLPSNGTTFYFKINHRAVFVKGSNLVPIHALPERVLKRDVDTLLEFAQKSHMNMIRVWGGGLYQSDYFYQRADELGIMIWQDFMFACSMYPTTKEFLGNVRQEVLHQVWRLQHHPSVVVFAGNNENEVALSKNWYNTNHNGVPVDHWKNSYANTSRYYEDYLWLYEKTIKKIVKKEAPTTVWVTSSPSNGKIDRGQVGQDPGSPFFGDIHFYERAQNQWNPQIYPIPRLASEYGFQSFPSIHTLKQYSQEADLYFPSRFLNHRQHGHGSNDEMVSTASEHFETDLIVHQRDSDGLAKLIYLAQVNQAESLWVETETFRRSMNIVTKDGRGMTMGALYWQLNSIWPGACLSTFEFGGKWKLANYVVEKMFRDMVLVPTIVNDTLDIYLVNDGAKAITNITIILDLQKYSKLLPCAQLSLRVPVLKTWQSSLVWSLKLEALLNRCQFSTLDKIPVSPTQNTKQAPKVLAGPSDQTTFKDQPDPRRYFTFVTLKASNEAGEILSQRSKLLSEPKEALGLEDPQIKVQVRQINSAQFRVHLKVNRVAIFVSLDSELMGHFSDNGFHLSQSSTTVIFYLKPFQEVSEHDFQQKLHVLSYYNGM